MTMTKTRESDAVDVAAMLQTDVIGAVRERFAESLAAYQRGVAMLAESGSGTLPAAEADVVLAACRDLGVAADRLASDAAVLLRHRRLVEQMDERLERNARQYEDAMRLKAVADAEGLAFVQVKAECDARVRAADERVNEAHRAYAAAAAVRAERVDDLQDGMLRLRNAAPHLFGPVDRDTLRRIVSPS
jgi:exonuclease VII small subunit